MRKKILSKSMALILLILFTGRAFSVQNYNEKKKPNIIFILIDDQRYDFLSFLNHPWIKTPNIDKLASNGLYFSNAFVTTSLCSPSRASIMTGQYAHSHQVIDNDTPLPKSIPTFPKELQKNGYNTAFMGKWHMGGENDMPRPGFNLWISFKGQGEYNNPQFNINGERVDRKGYTPDLLTDYACDFITENAKKEKPYFLYLSHKSIHEPFTPAERHEHVYENLQIPRPASFADTPGNNRGKPDWVVKQRKSWHGSERPMLTEAEAYDDFFRQYSECMLGVDESIGRIEKTLADLGQLDETVIIYYSDNGYLIGEHGLIDKRVGYEESIRVPAFVHCPDLIKKPAVNNEFILNIDIGPTILDLAGAKIPETMHGKSFLPLIKNEKTNWRDAFIYEYFIDPNAVQTPTIFGVRTKKYSYMTYHGVWDNYELYDMEKDPKQMNNLLGSVNYGTGYGTFLKYAQIQVPEIYEIVKPLEDKLNELLENTNGSRNPKWIPVKNE